MRWLLRLLNFIHWPLWLKFSVGFLGAILLPTIILLWVIQGSSTSQSTRNLQVRVQEQGQRQQQSVISALGQAQNTLNLFATAPEYQNRFSEVLEAETLTEENIQPVSLSLQGFLIGSDTFRRLRLLNLDGTIVADVTSNNILTTGGSAADTPAYEQASTALVQNRDRSISVYNPTDPTIDVSQAVMNTTGEAIGFVVGTLNTRAVILDNLITDHNQYPIYSFLISLGQDPIIFTRDENISLVEISAGKSVVVERILRGGVGTGLYQVGPQRDTEVIGYYAPIPNPSNSGLPLFAFATEVHTDTVSPQLSDLFAGGSLFVTAIGFLILAIVLVLLFNQIVTAPLVRLRRGIQAITTGNFEVPVSSASRSDEIGDVNAAFIDMRTYVRNLISELQARVAARSRDMSATQDISRFAASQRDLQVLMSQVVELIVERFLSIYHAQIYLIDKDNQYAVLRASTGEAGKSLLARGHRLAVGSVSIIGQTVQQGEIMVTRDTSTSQVHRQNEFLPETRAELAIPLRIGQQIIGALDVQSKYSNVFSEDEIAVLQTMADQIAVAIENARLYQESLRQLKEVERSNRQATLQTWQEYVYGQRQRQLVSSAGAATGSDLSELRQKATAQGKVVMGEPSKHGTIPIAVPILLRGQILGAVEWELPEKDVDDNKLQLAQELANRLAISLENARLFQESQRATERERIVNTIAAKLTPQTEISEILQTAVREVGQALRAPQVSIQLHRNETNSNGNHKNGS